MPSSTSAPILTADAVRTGPSLPCGPTKIMAQHQQEASLVAELRRNDTENQTRHALPPRDANVVAQADPPPTDSLDLLNNIHRGPWLEIHGNLVSYVLHSLGLRDGSSDEILQLSQQWAEWDDLTSLANYRFVLLDSSQELTSRALFSKALLRLSGECGLHPTCFTLTGVEKLGQQVAGGGFGDIWKGSVGGQTVAVKSLRQFAKEDVKASLKKLGREATIWRQLSHPNLLPFFGLYMLDNRLSLISPWMENGDLKHFLSSASPDEDRVSLMADVAMGLEYLHSQNVVHGDLKTPNILVTPSGRACITDFGLSTIVDELTLKLTLSSRSCREGTVRFQAPELLKNESSNHYGSDVYAFGCVSYEILTGKVPFFELANDAAIMFKVVYEGVRPSRLGMISMDLWLLLEDCWHQQADKRPTTSAISQRLSKQLIGGNINQSAPDWDDTYSARFRRSIQGWPLFPSVSEANELKDQGHKALAAKGYDKAIDLFSQAIALDPTDHVLFSNRSAAHSGKRQWEDALKDAEQCIALNPLWSEGFARKCAALHGAWRHDEAIVAYEEGLKLEDSPAFRKGLEEVQGAKAFGDDEANAGEFGKLFSDPNLLGKLAANPRTQKHLADPSFKQMASRPIPTMQDPRMVDVLSVLMGIDMQRFTRPEGSDEMLSSISTSSPPPASSPPPPAASSSKPPPESTPAPPAEDTEMPEADDEEAQVKKEAEAAKKAGSEAYRKREFEEAATQFSKAWDLWPKDITFLTNLGAVYFEQGQYDKAIEKCEKAVEEGRSLRVDFKLIGKAYGRIGSSFQKKGDFASAIKYFQKSLTEHRTPDILNKLRDVEHILNKLRDVERIKAEEEKQAYINPEKSATAREEGNVQFKAGHFASAVQSYTESIKRDPSDARGYSNRAAAHMKLAALPQALEDINDAIKTDPNFTKAYIRKSSILFAMRDYTQAIEAAQEAREHNPQNKHTREISEQERKCQQALLSQREEETLELAMRDPQVAQIMNDPVMQQILQQAQTNPRALQDHMKNPVVRQKIQKLVNAGIIRTG
ncbi:Heat shock protein sti1 [Mycena sanguinolenta]|uniref:Heat shock protein sti1 n=1 Tax=Mycena sanguinolenta TaxID=230812 RepID=A0A8H6YA21_9AGAR|nr:Heat shock protein sti1 [Mycena sanguinolenta]